MTAFTHDQHHAAGRMSEGSAPGQELFVSSEVKDGLELRLRQAMSEFVESPREAVREADRVLEETVAQLTQALTHRHHDLKSAWEGHGTAGGARDTGSGLGTGSELGAGDGLGAGNGLGRGHEGRPGDTATMAPVTGDGTPGEVGAHGAPGAPGASGGAAFGDGTKSADDSMTSGRGTGAGAVRGDFAGEEGGAADTERLRLVLREYRETTERLLNF